MEYPPDLSDLPPILYKYRTFDNFGWRLLTDLEVFFASPDHFNDPFDTRAPVLYEQGTLKQMYNKNVENLKYVGMKLTRKKRKKLAMEMARRVFANKNDQQRREEFRREVNENTDNMAGILSLSAVRDQTLMWSHYSDSHRGFCMGFDSREFIRFADLQILEGVYLLPEKMCYVSKVPQLNPYKMSDSELYMTKLFSKSQEWSYEKEYRVLCGGRPNFPLKLDSAVLHSITLGAKCDPDDKKRVLDIVKEKGYSVRIEEAKAGHDGKLQFSPL